MKSTVIVALLVAAVGLGLVCVLQFRKASEHQAQIAALNSALDQQKDRVRDLETAKQHLNQQRSDLLDQAEQQAAELSRQIAAAPPPALTPGAQPGKTEARPEQAGFGQMISKMLDDPETRGFLREQQKMMMDQLYGPLIKKMDLTPDEATKFKNFLLETAMKSTERASSLLGPSTNRMAAVAQIAADRAATDAQLKELLGDQRYAQYKDYEQTAGERMQLNQFRQQFGAGSLPLTEDQTEQLLGFMKEEKQTMASVGHPTVGTGQPGGEMEAILSEDRSESMLQSQEYVNERVYERAKTVLSDDQLSAFGKFQSNQLQMMRVGVGMARKFFAPEASQPATP
ncbi:MAG: hypothetical protein AB9869_38150 [Verrucomicrobiia bacterium]